ncbi:cell wall hydrolase [Mesorhizobium sp. M2A.F.Ca.ET.037.01.1.1]|uniref:cell wall hydrolase n=1 Tax=unclassified Mesorhizobium TaxID=325217 RepID=UPI000F761D07|nr:MULTISPECIES: cell wall hydrolase [unclassified Mesorhizobium]RUY04018.1 cell wall hydrolase [Mesorhizobium sp. M2A.F.Ca.ET.040.01.1.1]RVC69481.1 cell wall hydrolase [Mesorhizobium sp. M00.F.Ca.ET.038.03.1.1]RVC73471.1 cell wall hydrolase [Mesorhizobium sp. M2A.F.Ca.ET.046.02.1.1]AZO34638.1 cell wall hydrolase [Mesorhizobium sp. M2A.F.Ca.ET.046.03.2.1]RUX19136.1 cell wall hydrolase [Mesorhizobium sp. M2A.F.Ca.ET.037.01.1.1]
MIAKRWKTPLLLIGIVTSPLLLAGCSQTTSSHGMSVSGLTDALTPSFLTRSSSHSLKDKECLQRAMFFESNRSSRDGMIAVGTVVMNRLRSGQHGSTICDVVGEKGQFAPGVLTRPMNSRALPDVEAAADAVLRGERKAKLKNTMYFHTAGLRFPYKNMHYTMVAGGNAFYEKRGRNWQPLPDEPMVAMASDKQQKIDPTAPVLMASAEPVVKTIVRQDPAKQVATDAAEPTLPAKAAIVPAEETYVTASAAPSVPSAKSGRLAQKPTVVAMQEQMAEPDASRFGGTLKGRYITSVPKATQEAAMGFRSTPENTDAIGAMIVSQDRPLETN